MAKVAIEVSDGENGNLILRFAGVDLKPASESETNTGAQNFAIYLAAQLAELGMKVPDFNRLHLNDYATPIDLSGYGIPSSGAACAAIEFALGAEEGLAFLHAWQHGDFDVIRREWPEAPQSVFIGTYPVPPNVESV